MNKKPFPLSEVYGLLEAGPVVLLTTTWNGQRNVMTMSWHTMMEFEPPLIGCVISANDYTFHMLKGSKECVIAIPTVELCDEVVQIGNTSGREMDKFETFKLTAVDASKIKAPLIAECYANLECRLVDLDMIDKYNFFVLEVVKAWIDPAKKNPHTIHHLGKGVFMVSGRKIKLPSKMR
jgi:flavin reductase (DIM6/NTAB) family NADH-FMN oxidoreductase RutF